ncbi:MAG: glucodextranase DOMON-like domain-containing protein [Candidatus Bathyarchaeia archaeon]
MKKIAVSLFMTILVFTTLNCFDTTSAQGPQPLNLVIIWHFHQPFYFDPARGLYILPWVRIHSVSNYYKMAKIVSKYPQIKVTFTFTGSLLMQLNEYISNNATDIREEISIKIARNESLTVDEKFLMLKVPGGFFDINWNRIVLEFERYKKLKINRDKYFNLFKNLPLDQMKQAVVSYFSDQDFIDLATLFNLLWIDPEVANADPVLADMRARADTANPLFTRNELEYVLQKHREIMAMVIPEHKELQDRNQTEIIPSPYTHPIMPLLVDFGWQDDLDVQIKKGIELYETYFNRTPAGMWAPEMAVNEESVRIMAENGISWTATDQNILELAGVGISDPRKLYAGYKVDTSPSMNILFRDTELSNSIGFIYASKTTSEAISDFVNKILAIQQFNTDGKMVLTIALDGENPWEGYINNGDDFLHALYANLTQLQNEGRIRTITPREYFTLYPPEKIVPTTQQDVLNLATVDVSNITKYEQLPFTSKSQKLPEGSWSGKEMRLRIWIGDKQENVAYMWLKAAREKLVAFINANPGWSATEAMDALYRAEASDWCFWYSHDMGSPEPFDPIFKVYLRRVYELIGETPPDYLYAKFYPDGEPRTMIEAKPSLAKPTIDGKIGALEWEGNFTLSVNGTWINKVVVSMDYENLYLAVIPQTGKNLTEQFGKELFIGIYFSNPRISYSPYKIGYNVWARYQTIKNETLGFAIYTEASIWFNETTTTSQKFKLSIADGEGGFITKGEFNTVAINNVLEIGIPFANLSLQGKDPVYLAITFAENQNIVDMSAKYDTPVYLQVATAPVWGEIIFQYSDPEGDDNGPGTYTYPTSQEFLDGCFDLLNFTVSKLNEENIFKFRFKTLGGNPWNGPFGFSLQFVHVYIDIDGVSGSGRTNTFGARVNVSSADAWEIALLIGPGWAGSNIVTFANGTELSEVMIIEPEGEDTVVARVPMDVIGEVNEAWKYVVLVLSWDGYAPNNIREIGVTAQAYLGGGADADAVIAGVQPYVYDLLVPINMNQADILKSYSIADKKYATVYAVGVAAGPPPSQQPSGIPTELIIAAIIGVAVALLGVSVILKRRRKRK